MQRNWGVKARELPKVTVTDRIIGWTVIAIVIVGCFTGFLALAGQAAPF
jgi:hypothetical protein